jgi:hypothetical protein
MASGVARAAWPFYDGAAELVNEGRQIELEAGANRMKAPFAILAV